MSDPVTVSYFDHSLEQHAMRQHGLLGRGGGAGNALYAIHYDSLPHEARMTIELIINNGPFPFPAKDGTPFRNTGFDLPEGRYLEYTVPTPGARDRGARRIVVRLTTAQLFFTACHYDRVHVTGGSEQEQAVARETALAAVDEQWRNSFYIITGMQPELRDRIARAVKSRS